MIIRPANMIVVFALAACEPAPVVTPEPAPPTPAPVTPVPTGAVAKLFPLKRGHIYQYVTETDSGSGMMITRVTRADANSGDLSGPRGTKTFQYVDDGVVVSTGGAVPIYVLKTPFEVGNKWRGMAGSTVEIVEVGAKVTVPAGAYAGCIKTLELRGGDRPMRVATTYCPDIGIVQLEAASGMVMERAELKSYGPPMDIGPDGVKAFPPDETPQ